MLSFVRTIVVIAALGGLVFTVYWKVSRDHQQQLIEELQALNADMETRLELRQAMIDRLSRTSRVAHVTVLNQEQDESGQVLTTTILFVELDDDGTELGRQEFTLLGDVVTIDAWTIKFGFEDVADGHPLTGRTLLLLRRVYSELMRPVDGFAIDTPGSVPPAYVVGEVGQFQKRVWDHFWTIATDPELAASFGVRVAQGEAVYKPMKAGQVFELIVDTAGGLNLLPMTPPAEEPKPEPDVAPLRG